MTGSPTITDNTYPAEIVHNQANERTAPLGANPTMTIPNSPQDADPFGRIALADPTIPPELLHQWAVEKPNWRENIARHPNCYPELCAWLTQFSPTVQPVPKPQIPGQPEQSGQLMSQGAKQFAAGAKTMFTTRVAPAAMQAGRAVQASINNQSSQGPQNGWKTWALIALPIASALGVIALLLPMQVAGSGGYSVSHSFFAEEQQGAGWLFLLAFLLVIGGSTATLITGKKWARITTGIVGIITGTFALIGGFASISEIGKSPIVSPGAGLYLLAFAGIAILAASIIALLPNKPAPSTPRPADPWQHPYH